MQSAACAEWQKCEDWAYVYNLFYMKNFSNTYIYLFSAAMVLIVSASLAVASLVLAPYQQRNVQIESYRNILKSLGVHSTPADAEQLFREYIKEDLVIADGKVVEGKRAADASGSEQSVFVAQKESQTFYVVPLHGKGLWGKIWGYVALNADRNTISGVVFAHAGETPGLGAEIATAEFQQQFVGKKFVDPVKGFRSIALLKKGSYQPNDFAVDAISGGTLTSNGVQAMLYDCLKSYQPYFSNLKSE